MAEALKSIITKKRRRDKEKGSIQSCVAGLPWKGRRLACDVFVKMNDKKRHNNKKKTILSDDEDVRYIITSHRQRQLTPHFLIGPEAIGRLKKKKLWEGVFHALEPPQFQTALSRGRPHYPLSPRTNQSKQFQNII